MNNTKPGEFENKYIDECEKLTPLSEQLKTMDICEGELPACHVVAQEILQQADAAIAERDTRIAALKEIVRKYMDLTNPTHTTYKINSISGQTGAMKLYFEAEELLGKDHE